MAAAADRDGLNPEQRRAARHPGGPLMVLAGAGSGKTRVLTHRIAHLIEAGARPHRIWAATFTNKAAGEMRHRLRAMLGPRAGGMWIGTFHSTCARLLREPDLGAMVGLTPRFTIFDDDDQQKLVASLLKEAGLADTVTPRTITSRIDRAKNAGEDPGQIVTGHYVDDIVRDIYPRYQEALAQEDAVDFNDLLLHVLRLAEDPATEDELTGLFDHVLVDEFQDTNAVQYRLVKRLASRSGNLTVVGDDDQSIYSWRGAEPKNLLEFDIDFPQAEIVKLEQNYRSTSVILDAANAVVASNTDRHPKQLWTDRSGGELVWWEESPDERAEAAFIASAIEALLAEEQRELGDVAVLYRTHAQSRVLEEMMLAHGLSYVIVGGISFFQRKEIKDIRALLRLVTNDAADSAFLRVVNAPPRGIGKTTVARLVSHSRRTGVSLLEAARSASRGAIAKLRTDARRRLAGFVDIVDGLRAVAADGASVSEMIIQAVERSGYRDRLETEDTPESRDRLGNLSELVTMATDFDDETDSKGTLVEFEERISLSSANDNDDGRGHAVTLMTIHAAKGLEFPVVFVCGMEDGLFPSLRSVDDNLDVDARERSMAEERRLCYVAFTRAEDRLILSSAAVRRHWGETRMTQPSRFIADIPPELVAVRERPEPERRPVTDWRRQRAEAAADYEPDVDYDFDQRTLYRDVPEIALEPAPAAAAFDVGATVQHIQFGTGEVLDCRGRGRDRKLLVNFDSVGLKTILARYVERR
jgi:DNA helicase-2/ATP-dependent DNA helicase PcrA